MLRQSAVWQRAAITGTAATSRTQNRKTTHVMKGQPIILRDMITRWHAPRGGAHVLGSEPGVQRDVGRTRRAVANEQKKKKRR